MKNMNEKMKQTNWAVRALGLAACVACAAGAARAADASPWTLLPLAGGGCMTGVEVSPSHPNVWYAYADVGGPYRTDDAGRTWRPLHSNFTAGQRAANADHVRGLLIDPQNPDRIVLVAGWRIDVNPAGAYVSSDGGRTFRRTLKARFAGEGSGAKHLGKVLVRHPRQPARLLAATVGDGIFRSSDGGETWTPCGGDGYEFTSLAYDAARPGRVYASAPDARHVRSSFRQGFSRAPLKYGLFRSDDDGLSWKWLEGAAAPLEMVQLPGASALVGIFEDGDGGELRRSDDGGQTWTDYHQGLPRPPAVRNPQLWYSRPGEYLTLAAGPDFVVVCDWDGNPYRRTAADAAWRAIPIESLRQGNPVSEHFLRRNNLELKTRCSTCSLTVDPSDPAHWLTTDWYDLWESRDGGRNWVTRIDTINQIVPFTVSCDPHSATNIVYGLADQVGVYSHDGGRTFMGSIGGPVDLTDFAWSAKRPGRVYGVGGKGAWSIVISEDAGTTWRYSKYEGLAASRWLKDGGGVFGIAVDPTTDDVYVCRGAEIAPGKGGVYRSRDGGDTWEWFSAGMDPAKAFFRNHEFEGGGTAGWAEQIAFSSDGSALMGGRHTGEMYRLDRAADRWVKLAQRYSVTEYTFAADPFVPGRFLVATANGIAEYTDGGKTFRGMLPGSEGLGYALAFDRHRRGLVATLSRDREDICVSQDGGAHWSVLPDGLKVPTGTTHRLVLDRGRLFIHTRGSGVWTRKVK